MKLPKYPVYIPSKGRSAACQTAKCLLQHKVPFYIVVEPQEKDAYISAFGKDQVLVLPWNGKGVTPARNWIKEHSIQNGAARHWQLDDNIRMFRRWWRGIRIPCSAGVALRVCEDFSDRYTNVAVSGLCYTMFGIAASGNGTIPPFYLNCHVYSCSLIMNSIPHLWRPKLNEDTDLCLQVLADGWCTVLLNVFLVDKLRTMTVGGGNTPNYQQDGRLQMARSLVKDWPRVVRVDRRWQRPQHVVRGAWRGFDTKLVLKSGVKIDPKPNEYGMVLRQIAPKIKSSQLRKAVAEHVQ